MMEKKQKTLRSLDAEGKIIKAGRKLFFKHDYSSVSTDMLAKEAGISKATMYNRFKDKTDILRAVVDEECKRLFGPDIILPVTFEAFCNTLIGFGENYLTIIGDPEIIRFDQLMLSQVNKHPEMTALFYNHAFAKTYIELERVIAHGREHGFIKNDESNELLAEVLINGWEGKNYRRSLYGVPDTKRRNKKLIAKKVMKIVLGI
jgi:TetR/AcrR family transcriptional regulator, mexJK operon transcriptional repressor